MWCFLFLGVCGEDLEADSTDPDKHTRSSREMWWHFSSPFDPSETPAAVSV